MEFLTKRRTAEMVAHHPESLCRMARQGRFPAPVRVGPYKTCWVRAEVEAWIEARIAARDEEGSAG